MSHVALQRFLDRLLLRSSLSASERQAILELPCTRLRVDSHRDAVVPGRPVDHALLVSAGWAARYDQLANGCREIVAVYVPGDMCDLHSVVAPVPGWGVQALGTTEFFQVPHSALQRLVDNSPAIATAFWRDTTTDASILAKWVCNRGRRQSLGRLAHLICELSLRLEQAEVGTRTHFKLLVTQPQLAEMLGVTAVHTNRVLQMLRQSRLISTLGPMITIHDWDRLARLGEFDPAYLLLEKPQRRRDQPFGATTVTASE